MAVAIPQLGDPGTQGWDIASSPIRGLVLPKKTTSDADIVDIRSDMNKSDLARSLRQSLTPSDGSDPSFPPLLLWNDEGLKHFEAITYSDSYYLTRSEIGILEKNGPDIAKMLKPNGVLLELGSGNLRKTKLILDAIEDLGIPTDYYALDLDQSELERTLRLIAPANFRTVRCHGLLGTYDDARSWLERSELDLKSKCILSLGSTIGSFTREEAAAFLASFTTSSARSCPLFLLGIDGCKTPPKVHAAYNDPEAHNARFILNVIHHANSLLSPLPPVFDPHTFHVQGEYEIPLGRHAQYLIPATTTTIDLSDHTHHQITLPAHKKLHVVSSYKYDRDDVAQLWTNAHLRQVQCWTGGDDGSYGFYAAVPDSG